MMGYMIHIAEILKSPRFQGLVQRPASYGFPPPPEKEEEPVKDFDGPRDEGYEKFEEEEHADQ